jgi:hypothetical protein
VNGVEKGEMGTGMDATMGGGRSEEQEGEEEKKEAIGEVGVAVRQEHRWSSCGCATGA